MFLLDTNVVSELRRPLSNLNVRSWVDTTPRHEQFLCVISLTEIARGAARHPDPVQRESLHQWMQTSLHRWFEARVLPLTDLIAEEAGALMGSRERVGRVNSLPDALIAATAIHHGAILVTRNTKDFAELPIDLLDPWTGQTTAGTHRR